MAISMLFGVVRVGFSLTKRNTIDTFIFWMYFSAILTLAAEYVNYFYCKQTDIIQPVCIGTWIAFSVTLMWSMAFLATLHFVTFYILQTSSKDFVEEIKKSRNQCLFIAFICPIIISLLNIFVHGSYYQIFYPPNNRFQVIILFASLVTLLIIISIFTYLSLRILKVTVDFSQQFKKKYVKALKISLAMKLITFFPFLIIVISAQFTNSFDKVYFILLLFVNLQIPQYNYLYGINSYIYKIQFFKISKLIGIAPELEDSDYSNTHTQTPTHTGTYLSNPQRFSQTPSKVAEMAISRDSNNIRSDTQKQPRIVGSEKQKVAKAERDSNNIKSENQKQPRSNGSEKQKDTQVEMKQKAKTQVQNQ